MTILDHNKWGGVIFTHYITKLEEMLHAVECRAQKHQLDCENGVERVVDLLLLCQQQGKKVMWIGNGGSAAIASHSAIDYWRTGAIKAMAFNDAPLLTCISNDFGYPSVFAEPLNLFAENEDILVAISSSGQSENIVAAVKVAKHKGCKIITLSGFTEDNRLRMLGDFNFYVPSSHYGHVELVHSVLCHSFLDLFMARKKGGKTW